MIKFYSVTFTNKLGKSEEVFTIGTYNQVNDWAIKESSSNGFTYDIKYVCTDRLDKIKNLCNN